MIPAFVKARTTLEADTLAHSSTIHWPMCGGVNAYDEPDYKAHRQFFRKLKDFNYALQSEKYGSCVNLPAGSMALKKNKVAANLFA